MIAYASVYGNTENAASILASELADRGIRNVVMYDVSATHPSVIVAEAFRCSHLIFASTTYNAGIFCNMETVLTDLKAHNLQNRTVALIQNGSWAPTSGELMRQMVSDMKDMTILDATVDIASSVKDAQRAQIEALAEAVAGSMPKPKPVDASVAVEPDAFFKLSYGLFVVTAKDGGKDNGCIINTAAQLTDIPKRINIAVNKLNHTHDMILKTNVFNLSVLSEDAPFKLFQHFGFNSGRDTDKFEGFSHAERSENGLYRLNKYSNAFFSCKVISATVCRRSDRGQGSQRRALHDLRLLLRQHQAQAAAARKGRRWLGVQGVWLCLRGRGPAARFHLPALQARRGGF